MIPDFPRLPGLRPLRLAPFPADVYNSSRLIRRLHSLGGSELSNPNIGGETFFLALFLYII